MKIVCKNVPGGWQSCVEATGYVFGPTYNKIADLWSWQRTNLYGTNATFADLPTNFLGV
jgi:hypothetical protein